MDGISRDRRTQDPAQKKGEEGKLKREMISIDTEKFKEFRASGEGEGEGGEPKGNDVLSYRGAQRSNFDKIMIHLELSTVCL